MSHRNPVGGEPPNRAERPGKQLCLHAMAPKRRSRAPHQLPPGRHKFARAYVKTNQRERILDAIADVTSLAGYAAMSVEEICGTAGVSRRTFYDNFRSKEDAFLAALDQIGEQLVQRVRSAYEANRTFAGGVRDCLAAFLQFLADEPRSADMLIVEVLAAGPAAIECRKTVMHEFAELVRRGAEEVPTERRPPDLTAETIVGGIYEVVYSRVLSGQTSELPALLPDLAYSLIQPYLGDEAARRESAEPPSLGDAAAAA
jgi:AcrR family transcriptional regulator